MKKNVLLVLVAAFWLCGGLVAQKELTNELIWYSGEFRSDYVSGGTSMKDGKHYTSLDREGETMINKYSYSSGKLVATIAKASDIFVDTKNSIQGYNFSADEQKILVETEVEGIYRRSSRSNYYIYDVSSKKAKPLSDFSKGKQRLAAFSPDGMKVAFVRKNNIFMLDITSGEETQVTNDGEMNAIINGAADWVYEEEFAFSKAFEWSPNSEYIGYYRFDETEVKEFQMAMYGDLYPDQYTFKYPKAGEKNAEVEIYMYYLDSKRSFIVDNGDLTDMYIPRIKWTPNNQLVSMKLNRHQNHLEFLLASPTQNIKGKVDTRKIYDEKADTYIEINDNLIFLEDGESFLWNSMMDGYNHIYKIGYDGKVKQQITTGEWDVIDFIGVSEKKGRVYYSSAEISALEKHVYSIGLKGKKKQKLSLRPGQNSANFSATYDYYINYNSSASTSYYITLHDGKGKLIRTLVDNEALASTLKEYNLSQKEFFTFKNANGDDLNAWMIKPPNFDPNKEYPVYVNIYGGPGSNTVKNGWEGANYLWHQMLAQKGYIVASVDPRGTMYRGRAFSHSTYLEMGKLETEDFIDFAKHLGKQTYVDAERIGIQGWSYGGFMTALCMTKGADVYKAGISVAPVTNWRYYDSIYTERFMRTPEENPSGYDDNSPINHVDKLEGPFLLVHGSADDNVHYQNTMEMINALVAENKQFDLFIYPDRNHGIYGGPTRLHLYNKMLEFVEENL